MCVKYQPEYWQADTCLIIIVSLLRGQHK